MEQAKQVTTVMEVSVNRSLNGRGGLGDPRSDAGTSGSDPRPRLVLGPGRCGPTVAREFMPPWHPRKGAFVRCRNGWGDFIRAEIMAVPPGPAPMVSFGVRLHAGQEAGGWHWLDMSSRWVDWREES